MEKKQINEDQLSIILNFINKNYSVVREGIEGFESIDIELFLKNIWLNLETENTLKEYLLSIEGNYQVENFERMFELKESMVRDIYYQEKYYDPKFHFEKLNTYAQERLIKEKKLDFAIQNVNEAKRLSTEYSKDEKNEKARKIKEDVGYIYMIKSQYGFKIGKSKNIKQRNKLYSIKMPFHFDYVFKEKCVDYHNLEIRLHEMFSEKHLNGEWFQLTDTDINHICQIIENYRKI